MVTSIFLQQERIWGKAAFFEIYKAVRNDSLFSFIGDSKMYERDFRTNKKDRIVKAHEELTRMTVTAQANRKRAKLFVKTWRDKKAQGKQKLNDLFAAGIL